MSGSYADVRYLIGIGNHQGFDDSIGLRVAEAVAERGLDRDFCAIELGGNLIDLLHYLGTDTEMVLLVDSARMGLSPGDFAIFTPAEVTSEKRLAGFSTHEADLLGVLDLAEALAAPLPDIRILGIEPVSMLPEAGLSDELAARFGEYVSAAVECMASQGAQGLGGASGTTDAGSSA